MELWETPTCKVGKLNLTGKNDEEDQQDSGWTMLKDWAGLSSNAMWGEPEDRVTWRKHVSQPPTD